MSAVATEQPFDANNSRKIIEAKVPIKPNPNVLGGVAYGLTMGTWFDDGDEVPEDPGSTDDEYECQPPYISTLVLKGASAPWSAEDASRAGFARPAGRLLQ